MAFIHENKLWPTFHCDEKVVLQALVPTIIDENLRHPNPAAAVQSTPL